MNICSDQRPSCILTRGRYIYMKEQQRQEQRVGMHCNKKAVCSVTQDRTKVKSGGLGKSMRFVEAFFGDIMLSLL